MQLKRKKTTSNTPPAPPSPPLPPMGIVELLDKGMGFEIIGLQGQIERKVRSAAEQMAIIVQMEKEGRLDSYHLNAIDSDLKDLRCSLEKLRVLRNWKEQIDKHEAAKAASSPQEPSPSPSESPAQTTP